LLGHFDFVAWAPMASFETRVTEIRAGILCEAKTAFLRT
jgi:hypothetical protein